MIRRRFRAILSLNVVFVTMKISDKSLTQHFDVAMTSFSSDKNKIETVEQVEMTH